MPVPVNSRDMPRISFGEDLKRRPDTDGDPMPLRSPAPVEPPDRTSTRAAADAHARAHFERAERQSGQRRRYRARIEKRRDLDVAMRAKAVLDAHMCQRLIGKAIRMESAQRLAATERLLQ